jgi:hypothetical protein
MARNSLDITNRLKVSRSGIVEEVFRMVWSGMYEDLVVLTPKVSLYNRESECALLSSEGLSFTQSK